MIRSAGFAPSKVSCSFPLINVSVKRGSSAFGVSASRGRAHLWCSDAAYFTGCLGPSIRYMTTSCACDRRKATFVFKRFCGFSESLEPSFRRSFTTGCLDTGTASNSFAALLQHRQSEKGTLDDAQDQLQPPLLPLEAYDAYRRHIRHVVEQAVCHQRESEFRSLRLVTKSMSGLHSLFLLMLLGAPPTSLELLLSPHAQFCCLCLAQAASTTFWGFGISRPGPLSSGGLAVGDWRLAMGLLYLWICGGALITTLKDPTTSYEIQIPALVLLMLLNRRLASSKVGGVPTWWAKGSQQQMLFILLACVCAALGRAMYVERKLDSIMEGALNN
ncbi:hypothetical protein Emed_001485 [Eimeria media]